MSPPVRPERVLSTLNQDGSRHWLHPKLSKGRFLRGRQIVGWALIVLFVLLPRIDIGGRPAFLIDLAARELSIFGGLFRPSDGFILMLLGLAVVLTVFLVTALFGRVWCGWGCPQTVYLEHVFRPIERLIEGSPAQQKALDEQRGWKPRRVFKWIVFYALSFALANVFLAYFVSADTLERWVFNSPLDQPVGFGIVVGVSALMLFDFACFREQTCIVACPYGRLQTVLLDEQSLIVGYDETRGEPRGKPGKKKSLPVLADAPAPAAHGDCIDCGACVTTCPTGIDIRQGLQMECIGCAQCIDACDSVMDKIGKPRNLIGYTSKDVLAGKPKRVIRPRTIIYPVLLVGVLAGLTWGVSAGHVDTKVWVERIQGPTFVTLPDGTISSQARIKIENESDRARSYTITLVGAPDATLRSPSPSWALGPQKSIEVPLFVDVAKASFVKGKRPISFQVTDGAQFTTVVQLTLFGPEHEDDDDHHDDHHESKEH